MPEVPLTHCPDCGYDLHGLPARHRCPECGFEYDEHTRIWKPKHPWRIYLAIIFLPLMTMNQFAQLAQRNFSMRGLTGALQGISLTLGLLCTFGCVLLFRSANRRGRFIGITKHGILARNPFGKTRIDWAKISIDIRNSDFASQQNATFAIRNALESTFDRNYERILEPGKEFDNFVAIAAQEYDRLHGDNAPT